MRALTASELSKIRAKSLHFSSLGMIMTTPDTVVSGHLTAAPISNDSVVELSWTVDSGVATDAVYGMTCWVGSTPGTFDKGVVRIRKTASSVTLYIGETSEIFWAGDEHITVKREFAPWRRDPRVVDETTFYMDWDVLYSDQHAVPEPVVNMGIDTVVDVTEGEVSVEFDASDSFVVIGSIASYSWSAPGCSSSSGMTTARATIGFNTAGSHPISCTVTTAAGASHTGHRFVHAYDLAHPPLTDFTVSRLEGSFDSGGWELEITVYDALSIPDRMRVVLFARDWYQNVEGSIGFEDGRENIVFIGWVVGKSVQIDPVTSTTTFRAVTPNRWIQLIRAFPERLEDTDFADNGGGVPTRWTEMEDLTPAKDLWHTLHWRTTLTCLCDIFLPTDTKQLAQIDPSTGTLWEQLLVVSNKVNLSWPCFDKFSRLYVEPNLAYTPLDERDSIPVIIDIGEDDVSVMDVVRRVVPGLYYAEVTGVWYFDDAHGPVGAFSPGNTPLFMGEGELIYPELAMSTPAEAIELAGLVLGSEADDPASASVTIEELCRVYDVAPRSYVTITTASEWATYTEKRMIVRGVRFDHKTEIGFHSTTLDLVSEGVQYSGIAKVFPGDNGPPIEPPPPPPPPDPPPAGGGGEPPPEPDMVNAIISQPADVLVTGTFDEADPEWTSVI
jgi:hypothetical protein